jgi:hypothetical protein
LHPVFIFVATLFAFVKGFVSMSIYRSIFILALLLISHAGHGQVSATLLEMQQSQGAQHRDFSLYLSQDRVANLNEQQQLQELYDRASKTLYVLDHQQQSYRTHSLAKAQVYAEGLQTMFSKLENKLKQLPEEQRQKQTDRLNKFFNGGKTNPPVKSQYIATDQQGQFAGISCDWYDIKEQQASKGQTCVADPSSIKNGKALLEMLQNMNDIYNLIVGSVKGELHLNMPNNPMAPLAKLGKIPVRITAQTSELEMQLVSISEVSVERSIFTLPVNFTEVIDDMNTAPTVP